MTVIYNLDKLLAGIQGVGAVGRDLCPGTGGNAPCAEWVRERIVRQGVYYGKHKR